MNIRQALKMAVKSISAKKGRSFLTMLGIIIGLAAVILLVTYAQGQNMAMKALYDSMGTNVLQVSASNWNSSGVDDTGQKLYDYCLGLDEVEGVTPNGYVWGSDVTITYGAKTLAQNNQMMWMGGGVMVESGGSGQTEDHFPQIRLGNDKYGLCNDYEIQRGREISYLEIENMAQVCVLGSDTAEYLFSFVDPIDKTISVNGMPFRVVGVYKSKADGVNLGKTKEEDAWIKDSIKEQDKLLLLPSSMTRYFNDNQPISEYVVKVKSADDLTTVVTKLNGFLSSIINPYFGGYGVNNPGKYQGEQDKEDALQQRFLGGIAAISLVVAGIGIMNIMLVTVTERTREIGIRKAIGAERKSIIAQFLIEAVMICGIGGLIGIGVGYIATMVLTKVSFGLVLIPGKAITLGAFAISVALGIIFGLYPAIKASGLQPVEALRAD